MVLFLLLSAVLALAADVPSGRIVPDVPCAADASETYALYLPSSYAPDRPWPAIFAFDPGARGRVPVERYQSAAEQYGYIVAGSNNSRNGSWEVSQRAARAMIGDVGQRFRIDERRVYMAGMSGGARVAMGLALGSKGIAGVMASSADFPDSTPRKRVPFAVFGTAGTEDFNLMEMRRLDRALTSPHRLAVFEGSHIWLPAELATQAVEWMEIQAVKAGLASDAGRVEQIYDRRAAAIDGMTSEKDRYLALDAMAADFEGLKDISQFTSRAASLARDKRVRDALKKERDEEAAEQRETQRLLTLEAQLKAVERRSETLGELRSEWKRLSAMANGPADTGERKMARRVVRGLTMGARDRVSNTEYLKMLEAYRMGR
jgi:dienelactone hydrolase